MTILLYSPNLSGQVINEAKQETIIIYLSPIGTNATVGTGRARIDPLPWGFTISSIVLTVTTAPTGSAMIVDLNDDGVSMFSTRISIDAGETSSATAAAPYMLASSTIASGSILTVDIDQVGATVAGQRPQLTIVGVRA